MMGQCVSCRDASWFYQTAQDPTGGARPFSLEYVQHGGDAERTSLDRRRRRTWQTQRLH